MSTADPDRATQAVIQRGLDRVREGVRRRPLTAVGGALLAGFVLGNGTPRFVAQTALSMGLRAVLQRVFANGSAALDSLD